MLLMGSFAGLPSPSQLSFLGDLRLKTEASIGFAGLSLYEAVSEDYQAYGLSTLAHPMEGLRRIFPDLPPQRAAQARQARNGSLWSLAGLVIVRQMPETANGIVFATLEDESGLLDLVLKREVYARYRDLLISHSFLMATGILQRDRDSVSVLLKELKALKPERALRVGSHNWG
jgi:error-prone DNA polymerase